MLGLLTSACREFFDCIFSKPAHNNLTLASKGPGDIILKRLNSDSEQAEHGGNTTFGERQQTMAFGGRDRGREARESECFQTRIKKRTVIFKKPL